jgi:hypothetical protein
LGACGWLCTGLRYWGWSGLPFGGVVVVMTKDEALMLALEALELQTRLPSGASRSQEKAITLIRKVLEEKFCDNNCVWTDHHPDCKLAQPEQEPVAYMNPDDLCADTAFRWCEINEFTKPVYTTPPQRKPLTDEDLDLMCEKALFCRISFQQFARSIEAAHNIKE